MLFQKIFIFVDKYLLNIIQISIIIHYNLLHFFSFFDNKIKFFLCQIKNSEKFCFSSDIASNTFVSSYHNIQYIIIGSY